MAGKFSLLKMLSTYVFNYLLNLPLRPPFPFPFPLPVPLSFAIARSPYIHISAPNLIYIHILIYVCIDVSLALAVAVAPALQIVIANENHIFCYCGKMRLLNGFWVKPNKTPHAAEPNRRQKVNIATETTVCMSLSV